jgi:hypothetical protein
MQLLFAEAIHWQPVAWVVLGIAGALGLLAVVSPRRFSSVAVRSGQWVDSNKVLSTLDKRVDIDAYVLPFSRALGVAILAAVALAGWVISQR